MQIRILPSVKTQNIVSIAINGARRDLPVGQIVTVSDEELRILTERGIDYTYGDSVLPDAQLLSAIQGFERRLEALQAGFPPNVAEMISALEAQINAIATSGTIGTYLGLPAVSFGGGNVIAFNASTSKYQFYIADALVGQLPGSLTSSLPTFKHQPLGRVAMNLATPNYSSQVHSFLDRMKTAGFWGATSLNENGWPTAYNSGSTSTSNRISMEDPAENGGFARYVVRHNGECTITPSPSSTIVSGAGTQRVVFDWAGGANSAQIAISAVTTWPTEINVIRIDQEALFDAGKIFNPAYIDRVKRWGCLRFMDWQGTNGSVETLWSERSLITAASWADASGQGNTTGIPVEVMVKLCNEAQTDMWWCAPHLYAPSEVTAALTFIRDNLDPSLRLYFEWSNETWNFGFTQTHYMLEQAQANAVGGPNNVPLPGIPGNARYWYGYQGAAIMLAADAVFSAQRDRLVTVAACQAVGILTFTDTEIGCKLAGYDIGDLYDVIATTFYVGVGLDVSDTSTDQNKIADFNTVIGWARATDDSGLASAFVAMDTGAGMISSGANASTMLARNGTINDNDSTTWGGVANTRKMGLTCYEGNVGHLVSSGVSNPTDQAVLTDFFTRLELDPRTGALTKKLFGQLRSAGYDYITAFNDIGGFSKYGMWGALQSPYMPSSARDDAYAQWQLAPTTAPPSLRVSVDNYSVGVGSTTWIKPNVQGGQGKKALSIVGDLPPGRTLNGRDIRGAYTQAGSYSYSVKATDELGASTSDVVNEVVFASLPLYREFALVGYALSGGSPMSIGYMGLWDNDGNDIGVGAVASADDSAVGNEPQYALTPGSADYWMGSSAFGAGPKTLTYTLPSGIRPSKLRLSSGATFSRTPASFQLLARITPGSGPWTVLFDNTKSPLTSSIRDAGSTFVLTYQAGEPPLALAIAGKPPAAKVGSSFSFYPVVPGAVGTKTFTYAGDDLDAHGLIFDPATGRIYS